MLGIRLQVSRLVRVTITGYYRSLMEMTDAEKQMAINVFLGVFIPHEGEANIWDLPTDYYLHHTNARIPQALKSDRR